VAERERKRLHRHQHLDRAEDDILQGGLRHPLGGTGKAR
jgi:hypothetical protein